MPSQQRAGFCHEVEVGDRHEYVPGIQLNRCAALANQRAALASGAV
jgi:hypothetical protein